MDKSLSHFHRRENCSNFLTYFIFCIAASCFAASLFLPVFFVQTHDVYGYWILFLGWLGFLFFQFAWYAFPLMLWAIHLSKQSPRSALLLAILAILVATEAFWFTEIPLRELELEQEILGYGVGFYLWYSSFYLAALGVLQKLILWHGLAYQVCPLQEDTQTSSHNLVVSMPPKVGVTKKIVDAQHLQLKGQVAQPPPLPKRVNKKPF